jgi:hypothetical protein
MSCLATLCELAVTQTELAHACAVCPTLLDAVLDTPYPRASEAMLQSVLHLLNNSAPHLFNNSYCQNRLDYQLDKGKFINSRLFF